MKEKEEADESQKWQITELIRGDGFKWDRGSFYILIEWNVKEMKM